MTRRAALAGLAAMTPALVRPSAAQAQILAPPAGSGPAAGLRFRTIVVDTTRIAALGNASLAERLAVVLDRELREVFADLMAPPRAPGASLVARISSITFAPFAGGPEVGIDGTGSGSDTIEGVGVVTAGGRAVSETPILTMLDPGYSGAWYLPDIDALRLRSISHQFAWWLRREMGV